MSDNQVTPKDVPGNAIQSAAAADRQAQKLGVRVLQIDHLCYKGLEGDIQLKSIRFVNKVQTSGEWLVVVNATTESTGIVAFHSGADFAEALSGLATRLTNGSLKWKVDEYA